MVEAFTTTDSTLTIHDLQGQGDGAVYDGNAYPNVELPLVLTLSEIVSIERVEPRAAGRRAVHTALIGVVVAIAAVYVIVRRAYPSD